jgi:hypothetical protein
MLDEMYQIRNGILNYRHTVMLGHRGYNLLVPE